MATHYSILAWEIPWTEKPGGLSPQGRKKLDTTQRLNNEQSIYNVILVSGVQQSDSVLFIFMCMISLMYGTNELIYKTETNSNTENKLTGGVPLRCSSFLAQIL